jgi:hypothetical protein
MGFQLFYERLLFIIIYRIKSRMKEARHAAHTGDMRKAYISIYLCIGYSTTLS